MGEQLMQVLVVGQPSPPLCDITFNLKNGGVLGAHKVQRNLKIN